MSDQVSRNEGNLVPAGGSGLAPVAPTNPLVLRGIADLATVQNVENLPDSNCYLSASELLQHIAKVQAELGRRRAARRQHMARLKRFADALDPPPQQPPAQLQPQATDLADAPPGPVGPVGVQPAPKERPDEDE